MLAKLIRYNRDGYKDRNESMRATGAKCRCGTCLCCRVRRFLLRVEKIEYAKNREA